jgi:hypothetical protein
VEQVANLIIQNLRTVVNDRDHGSLQSKRKAITALLPYAVRQERYRRPEMLDLYLRAAKTSNEWEFTWRCIRGRTGWLRNASPRALVLVSPYIRWDWSKRKEGLILRWAEATSTAPSTEEVARSVVDTLLQIASKEELLPYIPIHVWLWLTKCPPLPPICLGRNVGTCAHVVKAVRALRNIEVLKSYFLLVWSEWNHFSPDSSNSHVSSHPPPPDGTSSRYTSISSIMPFFSQFPSPILSPTPPQILPPILPPFPSLPNPGEEIHIAPMSYPSSSSNSTLSHHTPNSFDSTSGRPPPLDRTLTLVHATMSNYHPAHIADSVLSHHTFSSSDSIPGRPPSRILDGTPDRHSSDSSNNALSHHTSNSLNSVSVRPPPPNATPSHHPAYITDSTSSRHASISSDSMPGRPASPIPASMPIRYSPPIGVPTFHPSVSHSQIFYPQIPSPIPRPLAPHPQISHSQIFYPQIPPPIPSPIPHSQIFYPPSSTPSPIPHQSHIPISMPTPHPLHIPNNMPSSYSSGGFYEMQISIREDFGGIGMEHHRAELLQRLDHVIEQLDRGLEHLKQHDPEFNEDYLQRTKYQYRYLRDILLEINIKSDQSYVSLNDHAFCMLTPALDAHRIPQYTHMRTPSLVSLAPRPGYWASPPPTWFAPPPTWLAPPPVPVVLSPPPFVPQPFVPVVPSPPPSVPSPPPFVPSPPSFIPQF